VKFSKILLLLLFIYYAEAAKQHRNKKANIQYTKKKAIHRNKTIKSIKHLHTIAAKMFSKIYFDQIFRRRNEIELTVDSVFLKCTNDRPTVFTTISKCMKSQIITIEHFQPEDDSTLINKLRGRQTRTVKL